MIVVIPIGLFLTSFIVLWMIKHSPRPYSAFAFLGSLVAAVVLKFAGTVEMVVQVSVYVLILMALSVVALMIEVPKRGLEQHKRTVLAAGIVTVCYYFFLVFTAVALKQAK